MSGPKRSKDLVFKIKIVEMTTYYFANSGSDGDLGTDSHHPWQHLTMLNGLTLNPGDGIRLNGGDTFSIDGALSINYYNSGSDINFNAQGTTALPITITTYGMGTPAQISLSANANSPGIRIANINYLTISNLYIFGNGLATNFNSGVVLLNTTSTPVGQTFYNFSLSNCKIGNFTNGNGFDFLGSYPELTFIAYNGVTLSSCEITRCSNGIYVTNPQDRPGIDTPNQFLSNFQVLNSYIYENPGVLGVESGWGIYIWGGQYITIQGCSIQDNGRVGHTDRGASGSGITVFGADMVLIQHNTVTGQLSGGQDGQGIECANTGCSRVVCQFNFVANNAGAGILVGQDDNEHATFTYPVVIRYNIITNQGLNPTTAFPWSAILLWGRLGDSAKGGIHVYGNTIYQPYTDVSNNHAALYLFPDYNQSNKVMTDIHFRNNIFSLAASVLAFQSQFSLPPPPVLPVHFINVTFEDNDWYSSALSGIKFVEGTRTYTGLAAWGRDALGISQDPTLSNPADSSSPGNYKLLAGSPCIGAGVNLFGPPYNYTWDPFEMGAVGMPIGSPQDFFGTTIPQPHGWDIGAAAYPG